MSTHAAPVRVMSETSRQVRPIRPIVEVDIVGRQSVVGAVDFAKRFIGG